MNHKLALRYFISVLILLLPVFTPVEISNAQLSISNAALELTTAVSNPAPGQKFTITARSYRHDINASTLTWTVDGRVTQKGIGFTKLEVTAPSLGKKLTVQVSLLTPDGEVAQNSMVVGSGSVDLIVESEGYVPPFFEGKVSPRHQNGIKIVAIPHIANSAGTELDPKTLVYRWKKNGQVLESQSGYGRQSLSLSGELVPRPYVIAVEVTSRNGEGGTSGVVAIDTKAPDVNFYIDDPLYGLLLNKSIGNNVRIGRQQEVHVKAVPFGFSGNPEDIGSFSFSWFVNSLEKPELAANDTVILRAPAETSGTSQINLEVRHLERILQGARSGFTAAYQGAAQAPQIDISNDQAAF